MPCPVPIARFTLWLLLLLITLEGWYLWWTLQCVLRSVLQDSETHSSTFWENCWLATLSQVHPLELRPPAGRELTCPRSYVSLGGLGEGMGSLYPKPGSIDPLASRRDNSAESCQLQVADDNGVGGHLRCNYPTVQPLCLPSSASFIPH